MRAPNTAALLLPSRVRPRRRGILTLGRVLFGLALAAIGSVAHAQVACPGFAITPKTSVVLAGGTIFYDATYSAPNQAGGCTVTDVTGATSWTSSNAAVAAFASPNSPGLLSATAPGVATVTASYTIIGAAVVVVTDTAQVTVNGPLAGLPGTPNQRSLAQALDTVCQRLTTLQQQSDFPLPGDQAILLNHCNGILLDPSSQARINAIAALGADHFTAFQSQALVLSDAHNTNILDRMMALRAGARGLNVADVTLNTANGPVSVAELLGIVRDVLGGGASADSEPGGLLSDRLGLWLRGNYGKADKGLTEADSGFDGHQVNATAGLDWRFGSQSVLGAAVGLARSGMGFRTVGGGLDSSNFTASVYGSSYLVKNLYVDGVVNYGHTTYSTTRHIVYVESGTPVDETATGSTSGSNVTATVSFGYDFAAGGLTLTPMAGYNYTRSTINAFAEQGAAGLNLAFDDQIYKSSTVNLGLQLNYAINTAFGVVLPHLRAQWLHEFENGVPVLSAHFAADPGGGGGPTAITIQGDVPNHSYWKLAAGTAIQFKHGIAGYLEYQRLQSYGPVSYGDLTIGLRAQTSF